MSKRTDEAGANATTSTKESQQEGAMSPEEQAMMRALETEAQKTGDQQMRQKTADDTIPTKTKNSPAPPPMTPEQEAELQERSKLLGFMEKEALANPAQRLSPLHDNEAVVATIPSLSTKDIDRGPLAKFGGPFSFAARGSKAKVMEALGGVGNAKVDAKAPFASLGKALADVAEESVGALDIADNQGISVRVAVSQTLSNFTATVEMKTYEATLPTGYAKLEDFEKFESEQLKAEPATPEENAKQKQLEEDARIGRAIRGAQLGQSRPGVPGR